MGAPPGRLGGQASACARGIRRLPIAPLIGEAIGRTASEESVSSLFD
jgi:ribose-phosphate pyrophosphokinase